MLLDHLKKFPVNATGGLMLAKYVRRRRGIILTNNCLKIGISKRIKTRLQHSDRLN
jgi:hypothetical protein